MVRLKDCQFAAAKGLFITGTDTEIGKTLVTGAIAHQLHKDGHRVGVFKPIASGCEVRREGLVSQDAEFLAHCADTPYTLNDITPVRYKAALTPSVAAEIEKRPVDWELIERSYNYMAETSDMVLVEGVGGVMAPLMKKTLVVDLMARMGLPVIVVARSGLGTINHTLMTVKLCRAKGLKVVGVVINGYQTDKADLSEETNGRVISECGNVPIIAVIPYDKGTNVENGELGQAVKSTAALVRWQEYMK